MDRKGGHIASMQATKPLNSFVRKGTTPKLFLVYDRKSSKDNIHSFQAQFINTSDKPILLSTFQIKEKCSNSPYFCIKAGISQQEREIQLGDYCFLSLTETTEEIIVLPPNKAYIRYASFIDNFNNKKPFKPIYVSIFYRSDTKEFYPSLNGEINLSTTVKIPVWLGSIESNIVKINPL